MYDIFLYFHVQLSSDMILISIDSHIFSVWIFFELVVLLCVVTYFIVYCLAYVPQRGEYFILFN
jgi:hypothetical protein